jgi:hypothetical protein
VYSGTVKDEDDQLLGELLAELFPEYIRPSEVFDYFRPPRQPSLLGSYHVFWWHRLSERAPDELLPEILDHLAQRGLALDELLEDHEITHTVGDLLVRALEAHGDAVDNARLYEWLGAGLDEYGHPRLDAKHRERVGAWLAKRPDRYKAVLLTGVARCVGKEEIRACLFSSASRLYGAEPPADIVLWYLDQAAAETHSEIRRHFFEQAAIRLRAGQDWLALEALEYLERWIATHQEFASYLECFVSCSVDDWRGKDAARARKANKAREQRQADWHSHFREHVDAIRDGSAHPQILHELAQVYLRPHLDIKGETPRERLADFLGYDEELIAAAYAGFRRSLCRDDLPSVAEIVDLETKGRMHFIRQPCLAGIEELYANDPEAAMHLDDDVLRKLVAFRFTWGADLKAEWCTALVKTRPDLVAGVLLTYALSLLRKGRDYLHGIWQLAYDDEYAAVALAVLPDLLIGFPLRAKNRQLTNILDPLLKAALRHLDPLALVDIISARLEQGSMSAAQRVYWLACGLMLSPHAYEAALARYIGASKMRRSHLGAFIHDGERRPGFYAALPESSLALLIELLAPGSPPERPTGAYWVSPAMQTADEVRRFIDTLGANPSEAAGQQLARLLVMPQLAPWQGRLQHAAHTQRIARRKAAFRPSGIAEICRTLANREPANAADLAALTYEHLRELGRKIRDGSTNDYRQYWEYNENHQPVRPKRENDCRDILLSALIERLGRLGIDAVKEGYYADDNRADIRVSFGGAAGFNVPIEIKKDSHSDLWRAMREQLIERYTRDPGADGFGIYLVLWFGGKDMPLPQVGKKPRSAAELEERLRQTLSPEEGRRISVCVIDCALPQHSPQPA